MPRPRKMGFRRSALDRLRFIPKPLGLRRFARGFGPCFAFALGKGCRVRGRIVPQAQARRRHYVEKGASAFLAVQHQPPVSAIGNGQGVLPFPPFGLAYRARCSAIAAMPAPAQR
jgi:hypothetical protein